MDYFDGLIAATLPHTVCCFMGAKHWNKKNKRTRTKKVGISNQKQKLGKFADSCVLVCLCVCVSVCLSVWLSEQIFLSV